MTSAKYAQCQGIKEALIGWLTNKLYIPYKVKNQYGCTSRPIKVCWYVCCILLL